jgi:hypothetical protein
MSSLAIRSVPLAAVLAVLLGGGCLMTSSTAHASKSAFFNSCSDLDALVSRIASGGDCVPAEKLPWSSAGGSGMRQHHLSGLRCKIPCSAEAAEKLLRSLKTEVEKLARKTGADIIDTIEGTGIAGTEYEGKLVDFEINYGQDNAHGKFEAKFSPVSAGPDKPGATGQELLIELEEWAG